MRLRNVPGAKEKIEESPLCVKDPAEKKGKWASLYPNPGPLEIEIGMGKGRFLMEKARRFPGVNFLGLELHESVLVRAVQKLEEESLPNLLFLRENAEYIEDFFAPQEISKIYLNFSDPWPKDRHAKRRLTSGAFLARYDRLLPPGGVIEFKTDNLALFEFSLEEVKASPFILEAYSHDLHNDEELSRGNILTEYEARFSGQGNRICFLRARKE